MSSDTTEALISMTKAHAPEAVPGTPEPKLKTEKQVVEEAREMEPEKVKPRE